MTHVENRRSFLDCRCDFQKALINIIIEAHFFFLPWHGWVVCAPLISPVFDAVAMLSNVGFTV